jgi:cyclophilin family peptidyl-prolyl cis-trans isomerase
MKRWTMTAVGCLVAVAGVAAVPLPPALGRTIDPVIDALWAGFDRVAAMGHVQFVNQYWRLPGNPGFDATIDRVRARLIESGFKAREAAGVITTSSTWIETYPNTGKGWSYTVGTLAIVPATGPDTVVLSRAGQRVALCINSFSTPTGGVMAPLVDVGGGASDDDYAGKIIKGAIVLGDADTGQLWRRAVVDRGALGVVSTNIGQYVNPDAPGAPATPRDQWNILQWGSIPYDEATKGFGFKATPKAAAALRSALAARRASSTPGDLMARVTIASTFSPKPNRTLVAEIPGKSAPKERVVLAAHIQEPGANDNASGVATLTELARAMRVAIRLGKIPQPDRTITFLWLDEIAGSRQWLRDHAADVPGVRYMFSLDMTGEDVKKTGGSFLIERFPDPGAVWERPWDPHTEWGRGSVRENQLKGDLLNDLHLAITERVARKSGWVVKTNPYEGGSDHTVFGTAGVPSVLDWHFTDRFYHTNLDTPDKTSALEMRNVAVTVGASSWLLASSREATALAVADAVARAGQARLVLETREGGKLAAAAADAPAAAARETTILNAWRKWYGEAVRSTTRLVVGPVSRTFAGRVETLALPFGDVNAPAARPPAGPPSAPLPVVIPPIAPPPPLPAAPPAAAPPPTPAPPPAPAALVPTLPPATGPVVHAPVTMEQTLLAVDRLMVDRTYPASSLPAPRHAQDLRTLDDALASSSAAVRRVAVRALGRFENAADVPAIAPFLTDADPSVRLEASNAVAQAVTRARNADVLPALEALRTNHVGCESLARLRYDRQTASRVINDVAGLPAEAHEGEALAPDAVTCVSLVLRQNQGLPIDDRLRRALRATAKFTQAGSVPSAEAVEALGLANDDDKALVAWAAGYTCPSGAPLCGWQVRYAGVQRSTAQDEVLRPGLERARRDPAFQVRLAALRKLAAPVGQAKSCAPLLETLTDPSEHVIVRLEAVSLMDARCDRRDELASTLSLFAADLGDKRRNADWQFPARALEALARVAPGDVSMFVRVASRHAVSQVRAAAARAATTLKDESTLQMLTADASPNVATEAIDGLVKLKSPAVTAAATTALATRRDFQLLRSAALALAGSSDRDLARTALLAALDALTRDGKDTSRDPRKAILDRLKEIGAQAGQIQPYLADFDPQIAAAAADVIGAITGSRPEAKPAFRAPAQPTEAVLRALPRQATLVMANGDEILLDLLVDDAPLAVARFIALVDAGYYNGLTFHRVEPLFVIQGGSPGATEYVGDARYWRDEIGLERHARGAVGLSTRGRDSADGQIFIDLTDQMRLNYIYTVFARVPYVPATSDKPSAVRKGMEAADRVLEGAVISKVVVRR